MQRQRSSDRHARGRAAEAQALAYLKARGLKLIEQNYRCRGGEIDLVMRDGDTVVFVEVRFRSHSQYGGAAASVDRRKQRRLVHAATHFLQRHRMTEKAARLDVVAIGPGDEQVQWLRNAISETG